MTHTIALAGKGGVGKTTICGMLIGYLCAKNKGAVLAVDADANANLNEVLGVEVEATLGDIREEMAHAEETGAIPAGINKQDYAQMKFANALSEADDYDLLVMGRTQGKGCYCFVNGLLSAEVQRYAGSYRYIVVDNEAGMEHISRGILPKVDTVILVSDCSRRGVQAAGRINQLCKELDIGAKEIKLLINRAPGGTANEGVLEEVKNQGMDLLAVLPHDEGIYECDGNGTPSSSLPEDNAFRKALYSALDELNL